MQFQNDRAKPPPPPRLLTWSTSPDAKEVRGARDDDTQQTADETRRSRQTKPASAEIMRALSSALGGLSDQVDKDCGPRADCLTTAHRPASRDPHMAPKSDAAVARTRTLGKDKSREDTAPTTGQKPQVITNAGIDEGVPPERLHPDNQ